MSGIDVSMIRLRSGWNVDEPGRSFRRTDGARCHHAPSNAAAKEWASKGPNGELRRKQIGRFRKVVKFLTPEAAMKAADRDWPMEGAAARTPAETD